MMVFKPTTREWMAGFFDPAVPAGATVTIVVRPQVIFRPRRLVYGGPPNSFRINEIRVGRNSQFAASVPLPADAFKDRPPECERLIVDSQPEQFLQIKSLFDNCKLDVCQVGMDLMLVVLNKTALTQPFEAIMYGDGFEDYDHSSMFIPRLPLLPEPEIESTVGLCTACSHPIEEHGQDEDSRCKLCECIEARTGQIPDLNPKETKQ